MNIIQLVGEIALFYLLPSVIGLFLTRRWNVKCDPWHDIPPVLSLVPLANFSMVPILLALIIWKTHFVQSFYSKYIEDIYDYFKGQ